MLRSVNLALFLVLAIAWIAHPCSAQPTVTQADTEVDVADPHIAAEADLAQFNHARADMGEIMTTPMSGTGLTPVADYWVRARARWWKSGGYWILGAPLVWSSPAVVVVGKPGPEVSDFLNKTEEEVAKFMADHFNLSRPKYAIVVRLFSQTHDKTPMPASIVEAFQASKDQSIQVAGVTMPPRFVLLPTDLPALPGEQPTVYIDKNEHIAARGGFHDVVMHEFVHAHIHALMVEDLIRHGRSSVGRDYPEWFDEGLAVYVTEKMMVEPGTKPSNYYSFSAPLHYIEDKWGPEVLSKFVSTAVNKDMDAAFAEIGVSDSDRFLNDAKAGKARRASGPPKPLSVDDFMSQAEKNANRPNLMAKLEGFGWLLGFLILLLAAVLAPAVAAWFYGTWLMQFPEIATKRLRGAFEDFEKADGLDARRAAAVRFLALRQKAPKETAEEWASQASGAKQYLETYGYVAEEEENRPQRRRRRYTAR